MVIIVQQIITRWTKRSRAAPEAALRNAVPKALALPLVPDRLDTPTLIHHTATYSEAHRFSMPKHEVTGHAVHPRRIERFNCIRLCWDEGQARVVYAYDAIKGGAPERTSYPRQVLALHPGEWGRVIYNGRHVALSGMSGWHYRQDVVNVAVLGRLKREPFTGEPTQSFSDLAHLR